MKLGVLEDIFKIFVIKMNIFVSYHPLKKHTLSYLKTVTHDIFKIYREEFEKKFKLFDIPEEFNKENEYDKKIDYQNYAIDFVSENINLNEINFFFGFAPIGYDIFFKSKFEKLINKNCFRIMWIEDPHAFYKRITNFNDLTQDFNRSELRDYRLEKTDVILSPSVIFFENCKIKYLKKSVFYFYGINPNDKYFEKIKPYNERKNKILLSGCISKKTYPSRFFILNKLSKKSHFYNKYFEHLTHPGYVNSGECDHSKTWFNYYDILQNYKVAYVGLASKPLNFLLAKIIETLAVGTLTLIEESPLLEKELGLIDGVHYISIKYNETLELKESKIIEILEDKNDKYRKIAENGRNYVLNEINLNKNYKIIVSLCNVLKNNVK